MYYRTTAAILCLGVASLGGPAGCGPAPKAKEDEPPECAVRHPEPREGVQDTVEYTGRTAAVKSVDVKARVTGFLKKRLPKELEGQEVRKGQELFLIDPEPYVAQLDQAEAQVGLYKAQVELTKATYKQAQDLKKKTPAALSDLQLRTYKAQWDEAEAGLKAAQSSLKIYRLNKDYTTVRSPIDGVVGRNNQSEGNVILQDQTLLTTVVALDPINVYFDMDAPTYAKYHQTKPGGTPNGKGEGSQAGKPDLRRSEGGTPRSPNGRGAVWLELQGTPTSPPAEAGDGTTEVPGKLDFFNNQFNPATDTILVRAVFPNGKRDNLPRLKPGMFVRVKLSIGEPYPALLVPDRAIISKMGKKYVYVVDAGDRVKQIPVVIGRPEDPGLRVLPLPKNKGGLTAKDRVIVTRLLEVQPGQQIRPVLARPPAPGQPPDAKGAGKRPGE
jgi:multidrug efflux system membrane fusion protein